MTAGWTSLLKCVWAMSCRKSNVVPFLLSMCSIRKQFSYVKTDFTLNGVLWKRRKPDHTKLNTVCSLSGHQACSQQLKGALVWQAIYLLWLCICNTIMPSASSSEAHGLPCDFHLSCFFSLYKINHGQIKLALIHTTWSKGSKVLLSL